MKEHTSYFAASWVWLMRKRRGFANIDFWQCTSFKYVCLHTGRFEIRSGVGYLYVRLCPAAFLWRFERKGIKRKADWESDYYSGGTGVYIAVKRSDDGKKAISAKLSLSFEIGGLRTTNERLLIMNKKKIDYRFKILYAVAILMVVAGHCDGGGISLDFAQWFPYEGIHLALFTFCSGYFFKDAALK